MRQVRFFAIAVLAFLGLGALAGSIPMITSSLRHEPGLIPLSLLRHSPFHSFLIPGILLLVANGLLPFWVLWRVAARRPGYALWTSFQGCVLLGWIVVQCWMLQMVIWWHYFYGSIALVLIAAGLLMRRMGDEPVRETR